MVRSSVRRVTVVLIALAVVWTVPAAAQSSTTIATFEDSIHPDSAEWSDWSSTSQLSLTSGIEGNSLLYDSSTSFDRTTITRSDYSPGRIAFDMQMQSGESEFILEDGGTTVVQLQERDGGLQVVESGGSTSVPKEVCPDVTYHVELANIDYSNNNFELIVNGESLGTYSFRNGASSVDAITISGADGGSFLLDNLVSGGSPTDYPDGYTGTIDGFEDGDAEPETDRWSTWVSSDGAITPTSTDPITGSYSGVVTSTQESVQTQSTIGSQTPTSVSATARADSYGNYDVLLRDGSTFVAHATLRTDGDITVSEPGPSNVDTGIDWSIGTEYRIEYRNIDYSSETFTLYVNGVNTGTYSFRQSSSSIDEIEFRTTQTSEEMLFDGVEAGTQQQPIEPLYKDFEDGNVYIQQYGYSGYVGGDLRINDTDAIEGSRSLAIPATNSQVFTYAYVNQSPEYSGYEFQVPLGSGEDVNYKVFSGSDILLNVRLDTVSGEIGVYEDEQGTLIENIGQINTEQTVNFTVQYDWDANEYRVHLNGEPHGPYGFHVSADRMREVVVEHHNTASEERVMLVDSYSIGAFEPGSQANESGNITLDVQGQMDHGSVQPYRVYDSDRPIGDTEVTQEATVTSSDPSIISVNETDHTLVATDNASVAQRVRITAEVDGGTAVRNVTVANVTLQNVHILPNEYWIEALITDSTIQWTFLASLFGALVGRLLRNPWVAIGTIEAFLLLGWIGAWVTTGLMATSVFSLIAVALTLMQVRKRRN